MTQLDGWKSDRIGAALSGRNPTVLRRMSAGFAVIGDVQLLPGYCVLLADDPRVGRLTDLPRERRLRFLADLDRLGEAVQNVCTHAYAKLHEGRLRGSRLICPLHGASFDCRNGAVLGPPAVVPLKTYRVRIHDGYVEVAVGE